MIKWPTKYRVLKNQNIFSNGDFSLVPLRYEDRYNIMKWRNEQIYHLRQNKKLTKKEQDSYFKNVISKLFFDSKPEQLLFSFLDKGKLISYGGLVHISWTNKRAEISFVIKTELEKKYFKSLWSIFINLIEKIAFKKLKLNKIFVYAFDLRPHLYPILKKNGFNFESRLNQHIKVGKSFKYVIIYSKLNENE